MTSVTHICNSELLVWLLMCSIQRSIHTCLSNRHTSLWCPSVGRQSTAIVSSPACVVGLIVQTPLHGFVVQKGVVDLLYNKWTTLF